MNKKAKILTFVLLGVIGVSILVVGVFMSGCTEEEKEENKVWFCGKWCFPDDGICIPREDERSAPTNWNECAVLSKPHCNTDICGVWTTVGKAIKIQEETCEFEAWIQEYDYIETCDADVACASYQCPSPSPSPSPA